MAAITLAITALIYLCVHVSAHPGGAPPAVCTDFRVGHPNTARSTADVSLELYKNGQAVSCFEKSQEYTSKLILKIIFYYH